MRFTPITYIPLGAGTVEIEIFKPTTLVAPAQVWLRASDPIGLAAFEETGSVYQGAFHEYYYEWTITDQPLSDWTKTPNLISAYNNPNKAYGKEVAFVLPAAGNYTISLLVTDRTGNQAAATTSSLSVIDPLTHYPTARRIYVDPDGDFTGVPTSDGSGNPLTATTMDSLVTQMGTFTWNVNPPMVLFRGGKNHLMGTKSPGDAANDGWIKVQQSATGQYFTSFGTGKAVIKPSTYVPREFASSAFEIWGRPVNDFLTFTNLEYGGTYEPAIERGPFGNNAFIGFDRNSALVDCYATLHDLKITGADTAIAHGGGGTNNRTLIADCEVIGWRNYGSFGGNKQYRYGFIGNRFTQHVDAVHGDDRDYALVNNHGPIRIQDATYAYVAMNDLFSRNGWSIGGGTNLADQPCLRLLVDPDTGQSATVERNCMEGGYQIINIEDALKQGAGNPSTPMNVVVENNLMVGTAKTGTAISMWRSGITIRNNTYIMPNVPIPTGLASGGAAWAMQEPSDLATSSADNLTNPIVIHSNTYVNLMDEPNARNLTWLGTNNRDDYFQNVTDENNVVHKPSMNNSVTTFAPIDVSTAVSGFTPRFKGTRYGYRPYLMFLASDVVNGGTLSVPYTAFQKVLGGGATVDGGGATNQAYWQAIEGTDTRHIVFLFDTFDVGVGVKSYMFAELGHFSVSFADATNVVITNTSGYTWPAGNEFAISLDRTSLIPAMNETFKSPATIPLPRPQTGSAAIGAATTGRVTPKDALLVTRPTPRNSGALNTAA